MQPSDLEPLGLTRHEAAVYVALLETGETKTGPIVKKTGLHRVQIYDALEALTKKGLASFVTKENRKYFQAADPEVLIAFVKEKEELARGLLPELKARKTATQAQQQVVAYEGIRGLKSALNNMLKELSPGGTHDVFASGNMAQALGPYYDLYQKTKRENRIKTSVIYDESFRKNTNIIKRTAGSIRFARLSAFPTDTWMYNDKVLIVTYTATPPVAILITSAQTAASYRRLFNSIWKKAKP